MQNHSSNFKIEFYQRLIKFSLEVISLCGKLRKDHNLWAIADQLIRAATSIGANVIEAKAASSKKDYIRFFEIALKSANETKYWLILVKEASSENNKIAQILLKEVGEIANILGSGILTMKGKK